MQAHISGLSGCAESKMNRKEAEETVLDAARNMAQFISENLEKKKREWHKAIVEVLQVEMQPNALSRKLNVSLERLILEYGIQYKTERGHDGRKIRVIFVGKQA